MSEFSFQSRQLWQAYLAEEYDTLSELLLLGWNHFEQNTYLSLDPNQRHAIDTWVGNFLWLFCQPDYILSDRYIPIFIRLNLIIANVVAISSFGNTDAHLQILLAQPSNFAKLLTLYSARNQVKIERAKIFNASPELACLWYSCYLQGYRSMLANPVSYGNLREHLAFVNTTESESLTEFYHLDDLIFGATYIDPERDRFLKQKINQIIQQSQKDEPIRNFPNPQKIAIVTSLWFPQHSVYRILSKYVDALKSEYELTLIHLGEVRNNLQIEGFKSIRYVYFKNGVLDIEALRQNEFMVIFYPDVGMSLESIILSNLRLAPIQICGTGHSVSTFGSQIDYYISGELVENDPKNYSERLVLLPDLGAIHNCPDYKLANLNKPESEAVIINCSWYAQKVNYPLLLVLKQILQETDVPVIFRIFAGAALIQRNDFLPFCQDVIAVLGSESVEIFPALAYGNYMAKMAEGDLCLESFPFGGCNVIVDGLFLRIPTVCLAGDRWFNRIGAKTLEMAGLGELVANTIPEYMELTLRLICDRPFRLKMQHKLQQQDLNATIFNAQSQNSFSQAITFLIQNHEYLRHQDPKVPIWSDRSSN
jgi:hypothetical protein